MMTQLKRERERERERERKKEKFKTLLLCMPLFPNIDENLQVIDKKPPFSTWPAKT